MPNRKARGQVNRRYPVLRVLRAGKTIRERATREARCAECRIVFRVGDLSPEHLCLSCEERVETEV